MPVHTEKLNSGHAIPVVGLGCWMGKPGKTGENQEAEDMVLKAIKLGYTHFDTASGYGNEEAVGKAIRESGVPREKLFVTTKLTQSDHGRVAEAAAESLRRLDIGYIDLYLVHWPQAFDTKTGTILPPEAAPTVVDTWSEMEKLLAGGKIKSIGVSNFSIKTLTQLLAKATVVPAVNQVESHPYLPEDELAAFCKSKGIFLTAYCPLGQYNSPILTDEVVTSIATKTGTSPGQVLLSWSVQRGGWSVVPKSSNPTRMAQNLATFTLSPADFAAISNLHTQPGKYRRLCNYGSAREPGGKVIGWDFEQLGWDPKAFLGGEVWTLDAAS